jgi:2-hydroxychromene-2-carboxylate isomerase
VGGGLLASGGLAGGVAWRLASKSPGRVRAPAADDLLAETDADLTVGEVGAPVLVEYASLTCPACAAFAVQVWPELERRLVRPGRLRFLYRDFPLDAVALAAAVMVRALPAERRLSAVKALYARRDAWVPMRALRLDEARRWVADRAGPVVGLAPDDAVRAVSNGDWERRIAGLRLDAEEAGVDRTPTFILPDRGRFVGLRAPEEFVAMVERARSGTGRISYRRLGVGRAKPGADLAVAGAQVDLAGLIPHGLALAGRAIGRPHTVEAGIVEAADASDPCTGGEEGRIHRQNPLVGGVRAGGAVDAGPLQGLRRDEVDLRSRRSTRALGQGAQGGDEEDGTALRDVAPEHDAGSGDHAGTMRGVATRNIGMEHVAHFNFARDRACVRSGAEGGLVLEPERGKKAGDHGGLAPVSGKIGWSCVRRKAPQGLVQET